MKLLTVLLWAMLHTTQLQPDFNNIVKAIQDGNIETLVQHLDGEVEISINDTDGTYDKTQAASIVKQFFSQNAPSSCSIKHSGAARDNGSYYFVGSMLAGGKQHYVSIFFKEKGGQFLITELTFEED